MFDMQDFCNFFALRQQHTVLVRDAPQNHDENHVHNDRRDQRAEADDGIRIREAPQQRSGKERRRAHDPGGCRRADHIAENSRARRDGPAHGNEVEHGDGHIADDGFYRRQLVLTTKEKPMDRADDPDLAEKMKAEAEGIFLWAFEGLQRLVANNFKFTESDRIRENREAVKRDNNNIFDFMESEGYIRRKADASISSKDFYEIYRMWCEENSLAPLKARSFSDAMIANAGRFNLEHCNNITNSAGRRVWGFMGVEAVARPHINGFYDVSSCTYVPEEWRD